MGFYRHVRVHGVRERGVRMVDAELMRLARMLSEVAELARITDLKVTYAEDSEFAYMVTYWDAEGNYHDLGGAKHD